MLVEEVLTDELLAESDGGTKVEIVEVDGQQYLRIYLPPGVDEGSLFAADIADGVWRFFRAWAVLMKKGGTGVIKIGVKNGRVRWVIPVATKGSEEPDS